MRRVVPTKYAPIGGTSLGVGGLMPRIPSELYMAVIRMRKPPAKPETMNAAGHTWTQATRNAWTTQSRSMYIHVHCRTATTSHGRPVGWYVTCPDIGVVTHILFVDASDPAPLACRYAVEYLQEILKEKLSELRGDPKLTHPDET